MSAVPSTPPAGVPRRDSTLLALSAAYVDTCGFIGLFGLFTAHVTGNFVLIGAEVVRHHGDILTKLLALPVFLASVVATAQAEVVLARRGARAGAWLLGTEALLIAVAAAMFHLLGAPAAPDDRPVVVMGFLLIAAMGVQNALMRTSLAGPVQTTVMTGNVTQIAIDLLALATDRCPAIEAFVTASGRSFRAIGDVLEHWRKRCP